MCPTLIRPYPRLFGPPPDSGWPGIANSQQSRFFVCHHCVFFFQNVSLASPFGGRGELRGSNRRVVKSLHPGQLIFPLSKSSLRQFVPATGCHMAATRWSREFSRSTRSGWRFILSHCGSVPDYHPNLQHEAGLRLRCCISRLPTCRLLLHSRVTTN